MQMRNSIVTFTKDEMAVDKFSELVGFLATVLCKPPRTILFYVDDSQLIHVDLAWQCLGECVCFDEMNRDVSIYLHHIKWYKDLKRFIKEIMRYFMIGEVEKIHHLKIFNEEIEEWHDYRINFSTGTIEWDCDGQWLECS